MIINYSGKIPSKSIHTDNKGNKYALIMNIDILAHPVHAIPIDEDFEGKAKAMLYDYIFITEKEYFSNLYFGGMYAND